MDEAKSNDSWHAVDGLTKREYFAAMALQGILASPYWNQANEEVSSLTDGDLGKTFARCASSMADALIKELNIPTPQKGGEK